MSNNSNYGFKIIMIYSTRLDKSKYYFVAPVSLYFPKTLQKEATQPSWGCRRVSVGIGPARSKLLLLPSISSDLPDLSVIIVSIDPLWVLLLEFVRPIGCPLPGLWDENSRLGTSSMSSNNGFVLYTLIS